MNSLEFTVLIFAGSVLAGFLGALAGLGGGVVVAPLLTVIVHVDIHYAIGAALVSVIATSSGAAAAYVREGYSNIRVVSGNDHRRIGWGHSRTLPARIGRWRQAKSNDQNANPTSIMPRG